MNKKAISTLIALSLVFGTGYQAFAEPTEAQKQEIQQNKDKLTEVNSKIDELNSKIYEISEKIQIVMSDIEKNKTEIDETEKEIGKTKEEIEDKKKEIEKKQDVLGNRMRATYKSGGQRNYLTAILGANGIGDVISKVQAINKVINIDKEVIDDLNNSKSELDEKVTTLQSKNAELDNLNKENQAKLGEFNKLKDDQMPLINELKEEQIKVAGDLASLERELIKNHVEIAKNPNSSVEELNSAISVLRAIRNQITSTNVDDEIVEAIEKAKELVASKNVPISNEGGSTSGTNNSGSSINRGDITVPSSKSGQSVANYALQFTGRKYVYGATGPDTFDCSGLVQYVYGKFGYGLPRVTTSQMNSGVAVPQGQLQPGDLVFPHSGHVAIYIGNGQIVHAPHTGDVVKVAPMYGSYVSARRIL